LSYYPLLISESIILVMHFLQMICPFIAVGILLHSIYDVMKNRQLMKKDHKEYLRQMAKLKLLIFLVKLDIKIPPYHFRIL
jgi:hypothetical protein